MNPAQERLRQTRETRQEQLNQIAAIQEEMQDMPPQVARTIMAINWPSKTDSFFKRYYNLIVTLHPAQLMELLGHPDPVGEHACNNVMRHP